MPQAETDFERARLRSFLADVAAFLRRRPNELLSFEHVRQLLKAGGYSYGGHSVVPLGKIVGTATNRYYDFDRAFLPAQARTKARWMSVDQARLTGVALPPIELYQVGEVYFVRDGHHRVSVAREKGEAFIDATVIRVQTRVPLPAGEKELDPRALEIRGEYAEFLEQTKLDELIPEAQVTFSEPGGYKRLLEHITVHQYYLGLAHKRDIPWEEAVRSWFDKLYWPVINEIRQRAILAEFPGRTEADLYLWIMNHYHYLHERVADTELTTAAQDYALKYSPRWRRKLSRGLQSAIERLYSPRLASTAEEKESKGDTQMGAKANE